MRAIARRAMDRHLILERANARDDARDARHGRGARTISRPRPGSSVLREGGNAIEAMVAAAATIAVVYPHMNGLGGDNFWLVSRGRPGRRSASTPAVRRPGSPHATSTPSTATRRPSPRAGRSPR